MQILDVIDVLGGTVVPATLINTYSTLSIPAYWRAINFISENLASFPRRIHQDGAKPEKAHPLDKLLQRRPNGYQNPFKLWRSLFFHAVHCGNGYLRIERDPLTGRPIALHALMPESVYPVRYIAEGETTPAQFYLLRSSDTVLPGDDVIHISGQSYDGMIGLDSVMLHQSTFQRAATLDRYQTKFLMSGSCVKGRIELPQGIDKERVDEIQATLRQFFRGSSENQRDIIVLSDGAKLNNTTISPQASQLIEQTQATTKAIAQITGVPPEFLFEQSEAKYNSSVEQAGDFVVRYCLRTWIEQAEDELTMKLLTDAEQDAGYTVHIDPCALLRGDTEAVNTSAVTTKNAGIRTPNEARDLIGLPPLTDPAADKLQTLGDSSKPSATAA